MRAKFEVEIEFDPGRRSEIIAETRKLFISRCGECYDEEGNETTPEQIAPDDLQDGLMELIQCAVDDYELSEKLGIMVHGMEGPGELEALIN